MEEPRLDGPGVPPLSRGATTEAPFIEQVSKIKISLNAKQDAQWEISVVAGTTEAELAELHRLAVAEHKALQRDLMGLA